MDFYFRTTLVILGSIIATGLIAIPSGNPNFIDRAIILELSFVTLFVLILKGYSKAFYACIPIAAFVIIGNSLAPPHVNLMMTFSKPLNAIILIMGGYLLQVGLIYTSLRSLMNLRSRKMATLT